MTNKQPATQGSLTIKLDISRPDSYFASEALIEALEIHRATNSVAMQHKIDVLHLAAVHLLGDATQIESHAFSQDEDAVREAVTNSSRRPRGRAQGCSSL